MIKSKTKYEASETEIRELFDKHKLGTVESIDPLGNGEFNAAYKIRCNEDSDKVFAGFRHLFCTPDGSAHRHRCDC